MINRSILRAVGLSSVVLLGTLPTEQVWGFTNKTSKTGRTSPLIGAARSLSLEPFSSARARASQPSSTIRYQTLSGGQSLVLPTQPRAGKVAVSSQIEWDLWVDETTRTPIFMQTKGGSGVAKRATGMSSIEQVLTFIEDNARLFGLRQPRMELTVQRTRTDAAGREHITFAQHYRDIPVWGAALVGHVSGDQGLFAINGRYRPTPTRLASTDPSILPSQAIAQALDSYGKEVQLLNEEVRELLAYDGPSAELYIWSETPNDRPHLVWKVEMRPNTYERWRYFVDAFSGAVLDQYQYSPTDGPAVGSGIDLSGQETSLNTFESDGDFYLLDATIFSGDALNIVDDANLRWTLEPDGEYLSALTSSSNQFDDPAAVSAHANMAKIYDYFYTVHGRKGINGAGGNMISVVHVTEEDGEPMANAYWNGVYMAYGDGGDVFEPLSGSLDVAAHEMAHGIIEHTANLEYRFQPGALNESIADVFGAMIDDDDWLIGEDIVKEAYFPSGALRNLEDPHNGDHANGWQPAHMDEFVDLSEDEDYGGVHINSGIPNRAAFLIADAIGRERTARIYYHLLTNYLTQTSNFVDCRLAAERAATDLYAEDPQVLAAVSSAFDAVGIVVSGEEEVEEVETPVEETPAPIDGRNFWVASVGATEDGDNSLFIAKPGVDPNEPPYRKLLTDTQVFAGTGNAITAPQHGRFLLFIDSDNNLRFIESNGEGEEVLNDDGDWSSIALSPDGNRLVATTVYEDSTLFYFDLENDYNNKSIKLYHTTTASNVITYATRFADAIQWDATGQYVVFDAYNSLAGINGETIDFWDIKVVNPNNEVITSWSPPLPSGLHLANPSFSGEIVNGQINDCRLLYEVVNENELQTTINVVDRCAGSAGGLVTFSDAIFTFPRFINNDREVVFEYWSEDAEAYAADLWRIPLSEDRLSATSDPLFFMSGTQSPQAFTVEDESGILSTAVEEESQAQPTHYALGQNHPNPFNPETLIPYELSTAGQVQLQIFDLAGQHVITLVENRHQAGRYEALWRGMDAQGHPVATGVYFYELSYIDGSERSRLTRKMLLLR